MNIYIAFWVLTILYIMLYGISLDVLNTLSARNVFRESGDMKMANPPTLANQNGNSTCLFKLEMPLAECIKGLF